MYTLLYMYTFIYIFGNLIFNLVIHLFIYLCIYLFKYYFILYMHVGKSIYSGVELMASESTGPSLKTPYKHNQTPQKLKQ